ncbi:TOM1-like protein 5 isoform X1 [Cucurbita moschata]|uniref:TOM1-like protein 5 isoform X1 n=2 Tax=Cucurbita moschata TaxID=3662 RepID=A0A6J1EH71_CUCMO|nr:TOM1-like protein 5 isoform X1 [Cucurbita moschata]XP_022925179.1 TOM1-like protein 5 isoform X1 [Cucurbita moschata]XP_022925180.1 TOM1-like protein 5 isoform X1 [Cucurbita moschata]XP_022925181.1 TOM1-like protein 5 isoform X1 [Cucurbita moschata]XP_022925182.1 TOM1-like protein 5 isoform X1 [Cucurbita moschata]
MASELVNSATSEKLAETDWMKNIEICELVARDQRQAKDVIKAIKKRIGSKNTNTQLYAVLLLEMLMNNVGETIHKQVIDSGVLPSLVKIVKKKSNLPVRERIFLLLDATQTALGGASGKFPQYYQAYYDLVSAGVQFPQRPPATPSDNATQQHTNNLQNGVIRLSEQEDAASVEPQTLPESSIIEKASNALEILKEVLDAVDPQRPEGARDEFTLDLVEQCSFQKQKLMHLVLSSRDEKIVCRAIELNEKLQKVLERHDALLSGQFMSTHNQFNGEEVGRLRANHYNQDEGEDEEAEQLFRRLRKGKACIRPEDENGSSERPSLGSLGLSIPVERANRPIIRPIDEKVSTTSDMQQGQGVVIPPPPVKHAEREKFFKDKKTGGGVNEHMRGLSLHSRNASSSRSGSIDLSES